MSKHLFILTGGSRGLGLAMAQQLLGAGHHLLTIERQPNPSLHSAGQATGAVLEQWAVDLAQAVDVAGKLTQWLHARPPVASATLINNACMLSNPSPLQQGTADETALVLRVGLEAPAALTQAFLAATEGWPVPRKVLNISSGLGRRAMAGSALYCALKAGMDHLSRAVALEQAALPNGARIVSLAPGVIDTDMQVQLRSADAARFPERERFAALHSAGQLDAPAQAAAKVLAFLQRADFGSEPVADVRS